MLASNLVKIEIEPRNANPKGLVVMLMRLLIVLGVPTFFKGGWMFVFFGVCVLFVLPNRVKNRLPVSFSLDENKLNCFSWDRKVSWSVPWEDVENIYFIARPWTLDKDIGLRLNRYDRFKGSLSRSSWHRFWRFLSTLSIHEPTTRLLVKLSTREAVLPYQRLDRPSKKFAELLSSYLYYSRVKGVH